MAEKEKIREKRGNEKEINRTVLVVGILSVLFFIASAYGVQRTILSTFAEEQLESSSKYH